MRLHLLQRKIVRICLSKRTLIDSTKENFKLLDVLPFESVYKKIIIVYTYNEKLWNLLDKKKVIVKRENRVYDVRIEYSRKAFGQKFIDYLGPKNYNSMPVHIKRDIFYTEGNHITTTMKKKSDLVIFSAWINNKELYLTVVY